MQAAIKIDPATGFKLSDIKRTAKALKKTHGMTLARGLDCASYDLFSYAKDLKSLAHKASLFYPDLAGKPFSIETFDDFTRAMLCRRSRFVRVIDYGADYGKGAWNQLCAEAWSLKGCGLELIAPDGTTYSFLQPNDSLSNLGAAQFNEWAMVVTRKAGAVSFSLNANGSDLAGCETYPIDDFGAVSFLQSYDLFENNASHLGVPLWLEFMWYIRWCHLKYGFALS